MTPDSLKQQLVQLIEGDEKAFRAIYMYYVDKLYFFTLKYVKSPVEAEELVQGVFVKLWDARATINVELSFDAFIFRIARNHTLNYIKRNNFEQKFREQLIPRGSAGDLQTEHQVILNETTQIIEKAISELPQKRQQIFRLSRLQGLDHTGIAKRLGISKNTVKVQMVKATRFVKDYFIRYQYHDVSL